MGKTKEVKTIRVLFSLHPSRLKTMDNYCNENNLSRSEFIRRAVELYMEKKNVS
jgi:metal-responsive CopG/Arc/MetJ family transcriptional regulator